MTGQAAFSLPRVLSQRTLIDFITVRSVIFAGLPAFFCVRSFRETVDEADIRLFRWGSRILRFIHHDRSFSPSEVGPVARLESIFSTSVCDCTGRDRPGRARAWLAKLLTAFPRMISSLSLLLCCLSELPEITRETRSPKSQTWVCRLREVDE